MAPVDDGFCVVAQELVGRQSQALLHPGDIVRCQDEAESGAAFGETGNPPVAGKVEAVFLQGFEFSLFLTAIHWTDPLGAWRSP